MALLADPGPELVESLFAIWRAGAIAVPISPLHPRAEIEHVIATAAPAALLATRALVPRLAEAAPGQQPFRSSTSSRRRRPPALSRPSARRRRRRLDVVHVGHHGPAQGGASQPRRAGGQRPGARRSVAVAGERSPAARLAPPPYARPGGGALGCPVGGCRGGLPAVRGHRGLGRLRRGHRLHGRADDVREADVGLPRSARRAATALVGGSARSSPRHQRLGRAARRAARRVPGGHRPDPARTLRHDRDRHGAFQSLRRPEGTGRGRTRAAGRHRRHHRRRQAGPRAVGQPGELRVRSPQMFSGYHGDPDGDAARASTRRDGFGPATSARATPRG